MHYRLAATVLSLCFLAAASSNAQPPKPFELHDGDRVVFVGDTLIEREQYYGYIELMLTTRFPNRNVTFRNLGWSADTPAGESRCGLSLLQAGHEPPEEGWRQLEKQLQEARPTVVILGYGMASSFAGEQGLPQFVAEMKRLMDTIEAIDKSKRVRFVLLSPIPHFVAELARVQNGARKSGDFRYETAQNHNKDLVRYSEAILDLAKERGAVFIPLFDQLKDRPNCSDLMDDAIHLNAAGYMTAADLIEAGLGWPPGTWRTSALADKLRQVILKKNEWFFHRSRPANMAYIFGFRKGEQGQNAVEIPQFDPLIAAEEKKIAQLRYLKPVELPAETTRTESKAAKFTPQPHPTFEVGEGLEVTLWAENPLLHKPIQMNFDPQGRLWVASSEDYPQIEPGQTANDKIIILEDTKGEGKADKSTVFAEGLLIPTGLEPGDGGVYVAQSTELLHYADPKGTGKATSRRIVLSGFGTEDTHHNLHTLRWGPDGRLWMNQSIYTRTDTETPNGVFRHKSGGVMRFDPRSVRMEILFKGWWNSWGHQFDPFGQSFITDGAGGDGISYGIRGEWHEGVARGRRLLGSISPGGYPKFCSLEIIQSRHFPDDWQGSVITCDFRANRVVRFQIVEDGAGYAAKPMPDVLRSKEVTFRPIDVKLGPDGALYVADWSNPIINHGEVDFRDPRRDRWHGRIWRISCKGRPLNAKQHFTNAGNQALFDALLSADSYDRAQARRVLIERGPAVLNDLASWVAQQKGESASLQALWLKQAFDQVDAGLLRQVLSAKDGRIRAAGVRVLGDWANRLPDAQALLKERLADEHPRVRLEAIRAIAKIPTAESANAALQVLDKPMDRFLEYGLWLTMNDLAEPWLESLASGDFRWKGREKALEYGLSAVEPDKAGKALSKLLERNPIAHDGDGPWIELIGQAGGGVEMRRLFDQAVKKNGLSDAATLRALTALSEGFRLRGRKPDGNLASLRRLIEDGDPAVRAAAIRLAAQWKQNDVLPQLTSLAVEKSEPVELRVAAIQALGVMRSQAGTARLRGMAEDTKEALHYRREAVLSLLKIERDGALPLARQMLGLEMTEAEAVEFWRSLLGITNLSPALAKVLRQDAIPATAAALGLRVAREDANRHRDLVQILERLAGVPAPKDYSPGEIQRVAVLAQQRGNAANGELIYRRADLRCIACHAIGGAGGKVGPDLVSLGASAPIDYIAESVYLPNKQIKEGFHAIVLATTDGKTVTGIQVRESDREIVLRDANDKLITIAKKDIEQRGQAGSLMPSGVVEMMFEQERYDLIRFLSELGKPGPFDATKAQAAKLWRVLPVNNPEPAVIERVSKADPALLWTSVPSMVSGGLPRAELEAIKGATKGIFLATRFDMPKPGAANFQLAMGNVRRMWVDGKPVSFGKELRLNFDAGTHTMVLQAELSALPERLVVKSGDVVFRGD
jgi:putative heme-binding domain-containing protein